MSGYSKKKYTETKRITKYVTVVRKNCAMSKSFVNLQNLLKILFLSKNQYLKFYNKNKTENCH